MKKLIATTSIILLLAACTQTNATSASGSMQGGMMMETMQKNMKKNCQQMIKDCKGMKDSDMAKHCKDITKNCQSMMKDMNSMAEMHKNMMQNCPMMKGAMMQNQSSDNQPAATQDDTSAKDHKKHHPAQ